VRFRRLGVVHPEELSRHAAAARNQVEGDMPHSCSAVA
jgi:hypothetical protein